MNPANPCGATRDDLKAYVDGELGPLRRRAVERHLARCPACRAERAAMHELGNRLRSVEPDRLDRLDPALRARILAAIPDAPPLVADRADRRPFGARGLIATASAVVVAAIAVAVWQGPIQHQPNFDRLASPSKNVANYAGPAGMAFKAARAEPQTSQTRKTAAPATPPASGPGASRAGKPVQLARADTPRTAVPPVQGAGTASAVGERETTLKALQDQATNAPRGSATPGTAGKERAPTLAEPGDRMPAAAMGKPAAPIGGAQGGRTLGTVNALKDRAPRLYGGTDGGLRQDRRPAAPADPAGPAGPAQVPAAAAAGTPLYFYADQPPRDQEAHGAAAADALTLDVAELDAARDSAGRIVHAAGGTTEPEGRAQVVDGVRRETLRLTVPANEYAATYRKLATLGQKVEPAEAAGLLQLRGMGRQEEARNGQQKAGRTDFGLAYQSQARRLPGLAGEAPQTVLREQAQSKSGGEQSRPRPAQQTPPAPAQQSQSQPGRPLKQTLLRSRALSKRAAVRILTLELREKPAAQNGAASAAVRRSPSAEGGRTEGKRR